jgi:hypothetical protein
LSVAGVPVRYNQDFKEIMYNNNDVSHSRNE